MTQRWCRPEVKALIQPLAWDLPYATSVALKKTGKKKEKEKAEYLLLGPYQ